MTDSINIQPYRGNLGSRSTRRLARRLAAYLPMTVTRQILRQELRRPGEADIFEAATMFADMSGFTSMAETLADDGPRGAEELNRALLITFTALINAIHGAGGAVSHFHGDAMMVYFLDADGQAATRALACARFMQSLMLTSFSKLSVKRAGNRETSFGLTIKIGVGYGRCLETVVGSLSEGNSHLESLLLKESLEFVLAGTAVNEAVDAQAQAESGQVVGSRAVLQKAKLPIDSDFRVVDEVLPVPRMPPYVYWDSIDQTALDRLFAVAPAFIPHKLVQQLQSVSSQSIAEHRAVTSMFVNFEGIGFDNPADGEKLQTYFQWAREIVAQFGGVNSRINRVLTGDKGSQLHIIFGAPVAPDAPIQATRCGLAMQQNKPDFIIKQRIGIAAGRVFACAVGSRNRREYTTVGSVINLSARLTSICPDGEVYLDGETAVRIQDGIICQSLPPVQLKGKREPTPIFRAQGEQIRGAVKARFGRAQQTPFGRVDELHRLQHHLQEAISEQHGGIVALFGPFGSGQMPLLATAAYEWLNGGGQLVTAVCQLHLSDAPLAPWKAIWRELMGLTAVMDIPTQLQTVAAHVKKLSPACTSADIQLWGEFFDLPADEQISQQTTAIRQHSILHLLQQGVLTEAATHPLLIIIEDIHWADQISLELIDRLAEAIVGLPVLLLLTYRISTGFNFRTINQPNCWSIPLEDLLPQRAKQLVLAKLEAEELPMLVEQRLGLRDRQGRSSPVNPLFLEESLKMMLSSGAIQMQTDADGRRRVRVRETALLQMRVPDNIYNVLLSRLDRLEPAARSLIQVAAVIGREFGLEMVTAVMPSMEQGQIVLLLQALSKTEMIQQIKSEPDARFIFQHALAHDVVYQSLPFARRQTLHAAIGDLLVARHQDNLKPFYPVLAYHYGQTDQYEEGLQYALAAAGDAAEIFANRAAADLYKLASTHLQGLDEARYWKTAVMVFSARVRVLRLLGQFTKATLAATEALKLCLMYGEIDQTLPVYNLLAEIKYRQARYDDVQNLTAKVINNLGDYTPPAELARAYLLSGMAAAAVFKLEAALNQLNRAEEICVATKDMSQLVSVWGTTAVVYGEQQRTTLALPMAERALKLAQTNNDSMQISLAWYRLSRIQQQMGFADAALRAINEAIDLMRSSSHNFQAHMLIHRATISTYLGEWQRAIVDLRGAIDLFDEMDDLLGLIQAYLLWGFEYSSGQEDWLEARKRLVQVGQLVASQPKEAGMYIQGAARLWLGLGVVALNGNHFSQAKTLFEKAVRAIDGRGLHWWRPAALYYLGVVKLAQNQHSTEAAAIFEQAKLAVVNGGCPDELPLILLQLAKLEVNESAKLLLLETAVSAAFKRSRFCDKLTCFQEAGELLMNAPLYRHRRLGGSCLAWIEANKIK